MESRNTIIIFFSACVVLRSILVAVAKYANKPLLMTLGVLYTIVALGFMYQFIFRPMHKGGFGGKPWWNWLRPLHATFYILFAILALVNSRYTKYAWVVLAVDLIIGITAFTIHYTCSN